LNFTLARLQLIHIFVVRIPKLLKLKHLMAIEGLISLWDMSLLEVEYYHCYVSLSVDLSDFNLNSLYLTCEFLFRFKVTTTTISR
jgi:hypothetical protein